MVQVFLGPGFSGSGFFKAQVFLGPGFFGSSFFRVRGQVSEVVVLIKVSLTLLKIVFNIQK